MKARFKTGECFKVICVGEGDRLYVCKETIEEVGGIFIKALTPPRTNSNGSYWFTAVCLKDYPEVSNRWHSQGLVKGDEIKFDYAYIQKISRKERRSR